MAVKALRDSFDRFKNWTVGASCVPYPPNKSLLFDISNKAKQLADQMGQSNSKDAVIWVGETTKKIAEKIEVSEPIAADGAWFQFAYLFERMEALIKMIDGPHSPDSVGNSLAGAKDIWAAIGTKEL